MNKQFGPPIGQPVGPPGGTTGCPPGWATGCNKGWLARWNILVNQLVVHLVVCSSICLTFFKIL